MNINTSKIISYTKKVVVFFIANIYRSACEHPFVLGLVFFLLLLYRFLPFLFDFLVSSSPIIICTALLLGTLLSFGEPNIPEIEEDETSHDHSLPCMHVVVNDLVVEKDESYSIESHAENRKRTLETARKEAKVTEQVDHVRKSKGRALLSAIDEEEERKTETAIVTDLSLVMNKKPKDVENIAAAKEETNESKHPKKEELHEAEFLEDATESAELVHPATNSQNKSECLKVEVSEPAVDSHFDSSLETSWKLVNIHDASDSDSDHAESSSSDASISDIIPMLDELHPLLDTEDPQPANAPVDDLHSVSGESTEDGESDDGSGEEEAENQEEDGEEETMEEKEDGAALAVKWTEDDEKNLKVLGTSELERNQRLENLIAKRIARKNLRIEGEKNLIDLDGNESMSIMDELSRLPVQIPPISTARRNPFDLPYDSEENTGLPPIPGSAPSVLLPRRNPFDLPHDLAEESGSLIGLSESHQGFFTVPQREMLFRRHESFALGASFSGDFRQEKLDIKLRPYFVTEKANLEETNYSHFQRQSSEKSDSKVSSIPESETVSLVADQDYNCELSEQQLYEESEFELVSSFMNDDKRVERVMSSLAEVDSVDSVSTCKVVNIGTSNEVYVNTSEDCGASIHRASNDFRKFTKQNGHGQDLCSPVSDAAESDVTQGKHTRSSSSGSSEISGKNFSTKAEKGSIDLQQPSGDSSEDFSVSVLSTSGEIEVVNDSHVVEPVYDSSPLAVEKSLLKSASSEEELLHGDKASFKSTSSLSSGAPLEASEIGSPSMLAERNVFLEIGNFVPGTGSMGEMSASGKGELWVAPPNLSFLEENESRSREVGEIREQDVIQVEFSDGNDEYGQPITLALSESAIEQIICHSSSSSTSTSTSTDSSEDSKMDMGVNLQLAEREKMVVELPHSDVLASSDDVSLEASANLHPSPEDSAVQASFNTSLVEQHVEVLPPIPKDLSEYLIHEEEYDNTPTSVINNEPIGSPKVKVPDVEQESSVLRKKPEEIDGNDNMNLTKCVPKNGGSLFFLTRVDHPDSSSVGVEVPSQVERMEFSILSERAEIHETLSNAWSVDSKNEDLSKQKNALLEHINGSDASDVVYAVNAEEIKRIDDDEALLLELDAIGDFHAEGLRFDDDRSLSLYPHCIIEKEINEEPRYMKSETGGSEVLLAEKHLELVENCRDLQEVEARSLEDIHAALTQVSKGTINNASKPTTEANYILDPQRAEAGLSEDIHIQASGGTFKGSSEDVESDVLHVQDVEARPLEDIDIVSRNLPECTDNHPPKPIDSKHDSSEVEASAIHLQGPPDRMGTKDKSELIEVEARSLADIDAALKHEYQGSWNDLPTLTDKKDEYTEVEATERNFELCILEVQTSEYIELAEENPHSSTSSSSASKSSRKKETSHVSDSSTSSSSSDSD